MARTTHLRGPVNFPNWRKAAAGTRVQHVRSGRTGTFVTATGRSGVGSGGHAVVDWDDVGFGVTRGSVVAPAFDLRPIS